MQVVMLCGGRGTRLGAETEVRPKPMVDVGGRPILWHIMKHYARFGHTDFVLCLGYKGEIIRDYFINYETRQNDVAVRLGEHGEMEFLSSHGEQGWRVILAETGRDADTGARVKRVERYVTGDRFMLTYGDGVSDVDLEGLVAFHRGHGKTGTVSAVRPPARFGELEIAEGQAARFSEKPQTSAGLINGGFMVFDRSVFGRMRDDDGYSLEHDLLPELSEVGELMAYAHHGFWQCVDTVRELSLLRRSWDSGEAPWRRW